MSYYEVQQEQVRGGCRGERVFDDANEEVDQADQREIDCKPAGDSAVSTSIKGIETENKARSSYQTGSIDVISSLCTASMICLDDSATSLVLLCICLRIAGLC